MSGRAYTLAELKAMLTPSQQKLADLYVSRLPKDAIMSMADFRTALNLHHDTAQALIDDREVDAADWGTRSKSYWWVTRESIVLLIYKRILGIRSPITRTLRSQARLPFETETTTTKGSTS